MTAEEQAMIAAEPYLPNIIESINDGLWVLNHQWCCTYINQQLAKLFGMSQEEIVGKNIWELFPDLINSEIYRQLNQAVAQQESIYFDYFYPSSGQWFDFRVYPSVNSISILVIDITKHKQAAEKQQQYQDFIQQLAQLNPGLLYLFDVIEQRNIYINTRSLDLLGYSPEALIEMGSDFITQVLHPDDQPLLFTHIEQLQQVPDGTLLELEFRLKHVNGEWRWFNSYDQVFQRTPTGQVQQILGTAQDITERKQFEFSLKTVNQQITKLLESITDAFVAFDHQWRYTYINREAARFLGRSPEELLGKNVWEEVFTEYHKTNPQAYQELHRAVAEQVTVKFESLYINKNCWLEISAFPFSDGLAVYFRDISDRKREEKRKAARYAINHLLAEATTLTEAVPSILQSLCESLEWQLGIIWQLDHHEQILRCVESWHSPKVNVNQFIATNDTTTFTVGVGLPGRVWASQQSLWVEDITTDPNFPRASLAAASGLYSALGFPIQVGDRLLGVIECFSNQVQAPDQDLLQMMMVVGSQIGQFMERQQTAEALRSSEERLALASQAAKIGTFEWNIQTDEIFWTEEEEALYGMPPGGFGGEFQAWRQSIHPDDLDQITQAVFDAVANHTDLNSEFRIIWPDGSIHWIAVRGRVFYDDESNPLRMIGVNEDITNRKQTEEALRESKALFESFMNHSPVAAYIKDEAGKYIYLNSLSLKSLQRSQAQVLGKTDFDIFPAEVAQSLRVNDAQVLTSGQPIQVLEKVYLPHGERYQMSFKFPFQDAAGRQLVAGVGLDVSDRIRAEAALQESEERYRSIIETANEGVWLIDSQAQTLYVNERMAEMLGTKVADMIGQTVMEFCFAEDITSGQQRLHNNLQGLSEQFDFRFQRSDGSEILVLSCTSPVHDGQGNIIGALGMFTDVTDRKRAEQALSESQALYQTLADAMPNLVWTIGADGQLDYVNQRYRDTLGVTLEEINQIGWEAIVHPEDFLTIRDDWEKMLAGGDVSVREYRHRLADGSYRWFLGRMVVIRDEQGQLIRCIGTSTDIDERRQIEQQLRNSEEFNRRIIESSVDCIKVLDLEGRLLSMNAAGQGLTEISNFELVRHTYWLDFWQGGDREAAQVALNEARAGRTGKTQGYCPTQTGKPKWWDVLVTPIFNAQGHIEQLLCVSRDITQNKQAEASQRLLAEASSVLVSSLDYQTTLNSIAQLIVPTLADCCFFDLLGDDGKIKRVGWQHRNPAKQEWFSQIQQFVTTSEYQQHPTNQVLATGKALMLSKISDDWISSMATSSAQAEFMQECQLASIIVVPLTARDRKLGALHLGLSREYHRYYTDADLALAQELGYRIALALDNAHLYQQAQEANRIKDEFLAVLSHELRSPLNPILGWTKLLRTRKFDQKAADRALETIERNAKLQAQLVEDLLDISRILRGKMILNMAPINLNITIESALETVRLAAEAKGIQIKTLLEPDVGQILGDSGRLQQIVWNLLSNAVKFTPSGGWIEIHLQQVDHVAQIQVKDNGKGIKPDFLPYVFEYFLQEDGRTTRRFGGLGLGLAIVRHLTELHGGTVQAESLGEGLGAIFTVKLPLMTPVLIVSPDAQPPVEIDNLSQFRILGVDDEPDMRELLMMILEPLGAEVQVVGSAVEALIALEKFQPNLLISDIGMPNMDGYMLMRQIRKLPLEQGGMIPAIALTAYAGELNQKHALEAGFQQHIAKPIEPADLIRTIAAVMGKICNL